MATDGYVFISYSSARSDSALAVQSVMEKAGLSTWMAPRDIPPGKSYAQTITLAIKNCSCFLLLLTEPVLSSIWVPKETERAVSYGKPIIPVMLEDIELNEELEFYLSSSQIMRLDDLRKSSDGMQKLLEAARTFCERGPQSDDAEALSGDGDASRGSSSDTARAADADTLRAEKRMPIILWAVEVAVALASYPFAGASMLAFNVCVGVVLGLIPMLLARKRGDLFLSRISWPIVTIAGTMVNVYAAVPVAIIFLVAIFRTGKRRA